MTIASDPAGLEPTIRYEDLDVPVSAPCARFEEFDKLREQAPAHFGTALGNEFWLITRMAEIRATYQNTDAISNRAVVPHQPDPPYKWIPEMLDPPEHTKWRKLLGPFFAPGAVDRLEPKLRQRFDEIMDDVVDRGRCDYVADVALRFPNTIFMEMMGLPISDADQFQVWQTAILHKGASAPEAAFQAMLEVNDYFAALIAERRRNPREDIVSIASTWRIDGEPVSEEDLHGLCLLLFMAGLDTVAMQLSYSMYHLAANPEDRRRVVEDPALFAPAIEEFLRYYAFVTPGRKVVKDTEIAGCPVKAGQMVWLPLVSANRDPREFPDADKVIIDRKDNRHLAFGAGPHRCLGSHLARRELTIGLTEWHRRIPDYHLDPDVEIREHGGQIGLDNLPLVWNVRG
ncbi:Cytochrome P450 [Thermomonospora echinospora]|uniref:Cytochrome P450 n=1 Tax=Thermomonospora echinospora TaxID=1992 RepID=A0A1H6DTE5_9ACTN|nr:cytochrome P450 [Thermomonospora echinospora]SEG88499.1 Cytochrome P450 [Thermomonospora echinospora]